MDWPRDGGVCDVNFDAAADMLSRTSSEIGKQDKRPGPRTEGKAHVRIKTNGILSNT